MCRLTRSEIVPHLFELALVRRTLTSTFTIDAAETFSYVDNHGRAPLTLQLGKLSQLQRNQCDATVSTSLSSHSAPAARAVGLGVVLSLVKAWVHDFEWPMSTG